MSDASDDRGPVSEATGTGDLSAGGYPADLCGTCWVRHKPGENTCCTGWRTFTEADERDAQASGFGAMLGEYRDDARRVGPRAPETPVESAILDRAEAAMGRARGDVCLACGSADLVGIGCGSCGWTGEPIATPESEGAGAAPCHLCDPGDRSACFARRPAMAGVCVCRCHNATDKPGQWSRGGEGTGASEPTRPVLAWTKDDPIPGRIDHWEAYAGYFRMSVRLDLDGLYRWTDGKGDGFATLEGAQVNAETFWRGFAPTIADDSHVAMRALATRPRRHDAVGLVCEPFVPSAKAAAETVEEMRRVGEGDAGELARLLPGLAHDIEMVTELRLESQRSTPIQRVARAAELLTRERERLMTALREEETRGPLKRLRARVAGLEAQLTAPPVGSVGAVCEPSPGDRKARFRCILASWSPQKRRRGLINLIEWATMPDDDDEDVAPRAPEVE